MSLQPTLDTGGNNMQQVFDRHLYRVLLAAALLAITIGTVFYHIVEKFSWLNAYYFSVVTLATVGYGDIVPHTALGKVFTTFYIFVGVGILTTFINYNLRRRQAKMSERRHPK
jgi:voltage-gated potassium channel